MARVSSDIRSGPSRKNCYLRFVNNTLRKVNVVWIDYGGSSKTYGTLEPHRHFDMHTYEGHPWIAEDTVSKKRMMMNSTEVFFPKSSQNQSQGSSGQHRCYVPALSNNELNGQQMKREYVYITLPVFSLLELSAEVIIKSVRNRGDIRSLILPRRLQAMLSYEYFQH